MATETMEDCEPPLFTFGIIADIQYADIDDGFNFKQTRKRYYRNSLRLLQKANEGWNVEQVKPSFILQLGDIIDGFNKKFDASQCALDRVMREFNHSPAVHHVWGNHEFYNFTRGVLFSSVLNTKSNQDRVSDPDEFYAYHFSPTPNFRFVVLDAYDLSVIGREQASEKYKQSLKLLKEHNNKEDLNHPPVFSGLEQRFVKFNGGFSQDQLEWLDKVLSEADEAQEKVTVASHLPVHPDSTDPICLAWNYSEVLSILQSHRSVVCFMAGHDHDGGYHRDASGIHYLTLEGVIETPPESNAFGTMHVYADRMVLKGNGRISDRVLAYPGNL
ncbi:manganese-dependent ADP-ribose/CDP-alcohol diphosphatase [Clupea harengus]|uniref:Manganese-dependent ADP-ribose/CDP-alcohol diphosphatase n=1 Tax=Clupea harengus TaxID=7950 RepID=A0A8M1KC82_CLUHA|nr:manganese-dependent ADP-ribose/CDP-alcohol diphosphatase [Clupea harengus]